MEQAQASWMALGTETIPRRGKKCYLSSHPPQLASGPSGRQTPSHPPGHPKGTVPLRQASLWLLCSRVLSQFECALTENGT